MRTKDIEYLLTTLEVPIPTAITIAIKARDAGPDPVEVGRLVQQRVQKGESFGEASRIVPRGLVDDSRRRVEVAIMEAASHLLAIKRDLTLTLFEDYRKLGDGVPATPEAAIYASPALQAKFHQRQAQAERYGRLYRLHQLLVEDMVNPTAWQLFSDTRAWPNPESQAVAFGEHDAKHAEALPVRLKFLVSHTEFWQPDGQQATAYWLTYSRERFAPKAATPMRMSSRIGS